MSKFWAKSDKIQLLSPLCGSLRSKWHYHVLRTQLCRLWVSQLGNVEGFRTHSPFRYAASRLIGALRFARGFKKSACYLWGFRFFFLKIPPFFKLEVGFFSAKKKFFADFPNFGTFIPSKLYFWKNSQKIREPFLVTKYPHFETWSRIFFQ